MKSLITQINESLKRKPRYLIKAQKDASGFTIKFFDLMYDRSDYAVFDGKQFVDKDARGRSYYAGGLKALQSIFKSANIDPVIFTRPGNLNKTFALLTDNYPYGKIVGYEEYQYQAPRGF